MKKTIFFTRKNHKYISDEDGSEITVSMLAKSEHAITDGKGWIIIEYDIDKAILNILIKLKNNQLSIKESLKQIKELL